MENLNERKQRRAAWSVRKMTREAGQEHTRVKLMQTLKQVVIAQVEFNLLDAEAQYGIELDGLVTEPSELSTGTASNDLYMVLGHSGGSLEGRLEFNADLFTPATAQRLVDDWQVWPFTSWP